MTASRRTRLVDRGYKPLAPRDPNISYVFVATEDTYAAAMYLHELQDRGLIDQHRVRVVPLPTLDGKSTLPALLDRLAAVRAGPGIQLAEDEYWTVFDIDRQAPSTLDACVETANAHGYSLAGTNPCFELWLVLHLSDNLGAVLSGQQDRGAGEKCEALLHRLLQDGDPRARGYNKSSPGPERFATRAQIDAACRRARALAPDASATTWPQDLGTHMHLRIERLPRGRTEPAA